MEVVRKEIGCKLEVVAEWDSLEECRTKIAALISSASAVAEHMDLWLLQRRGEHTDSTVVVLEAGRVLMTEVHLG